ncbi:MAG: HupE/UreJ family protein, partial [Hyphomicrobiaceae bacterium]
QVPAAFVAAMAMGYGLALAGVALPLVEPAILASVVVIGLLVAIAAPVPASAGMAIVALFGVFHGFAHGGEIGTAGIAGYGIGFALATMALHLAGVGVGISLMAVLGRTSGVAASRMIGGAAAAGGLVLVLVN